MPQTPWTSTKAFSILLLLQACWYVAISASLQQQPLHATPPPSHPPHQQQSQCSPPQPQYTTNRSMHHLSLRLEPLIASQAPYHLSHQLLGPKICARPAQAQQQQQQQTSQPLHTFRMHLPFPTTPTHSTSHSACQHSSRHK